jgi:hypothetical protein
MRTKRKAARFRRFAGPRYVWLAPEFIAAIRGDA